MLDTESDDPTSDNTVSQQPTLTASPPTQTFLSSPDFQPHFADVPTRGILLNNRNAPVRHPSHKNKRPVHVSASSIKTVEDTGSRVSFADETEDVCIPMTKENKHSVGIDFSELERLSEHDKDYNEPNNMYKPAFCNYHHTHRPMVPESMLHDSTVSTVKDLSAIYSSDEEDLNEKNEKCDPVLPVSPNVTFGTCKDDSTIDRFTFFSSEFENTVHAPVISQLTSGNNTFETLFNSGKGTWWLDCLDPTDAEMRALSKAFGIHPLTTEDIRMKETREKVELFKNYYFVCFHTFDGDKESEEFLEPVNMYLVVFRDGILSFHFSPISHSLNVRRRIRQLMDYVTVTSDWICYAIIDDITDSFAPIMRFIEIETDVIEDSIFTAREEDFSPMLMRIGEARRNVMSVLRLMTGKADVIKMFAKRCNENWDNAPRSEIGLYLGDIQDHIVTMHQNLYAYEKILSRTHSNYLAQLQVQSVNSNNRVTKVLGRVTLIGTILVPLNLITGLFGMNVHVPGQGGTSFGWFFGIVGAIILIVVVLSFIASKWLGEAESEGETISSTIPSRFSRRITNTESSIRSFGSRLSRFNSRSSR
jgi:magnesium transporter